MNSEKHVNISKEEPEQDEVVRPAGFVVSALLAVASAAMAKSIIENTSSKNFSWIIMTSDIGCIMMLTYFIMSCAIPSYLIGKPEIWKMAPLVMGGILTFLAGILALFQNDMNKDIFVWLEFLSPVPFVAYAYFVHMLDDDEGSLWVMLKPWRKGGDNCNSTV